MTYERFGKHVGSVQPASELPRTSSVRARCTHQHATVAMTDDPRKITPPMSRLASVRFTGLGVGVALGTSLEGTRR